MGNGFKCLMSLLYLGDEMGGGTNGDKPEKIIDIINCGLFCHGHPIDGIVDGKRITYTGVEKVEQEDGTITYRCRIQAKCPLPKVYEKAEL
jgi:hypothetical protein